MAVEVGKTGHCTLPAQVVSAIIARAVEDCLERPLVRAMGLDVVVWGYGELTSVSGRGAASGIVLGMA
jgi:hypothetical protein